MKALLLSDLHFHNFQQFARVENGMNSRLAWSLHAVTQAFIYAMNHEIQHVFILGDVFHSHSKIDVDVLHYAYNVFATYSKEFNIYILVGNHDQASKDGRIHSLNIFDDIAKVIDRPELLDIDGCEIYAVPHMQPNDFKALVFPDDIDVFLFHQGVNEGAVGAFNINLKTNISLKDLPDAKFRFGGHYHKHQQLDERTWYVGSQIQHNFGERGEVKGFVVLDTDAGTVEHIETTAPKFYQFDSVAAFKESGIDPEENYVRLVLDTDEEVQLDNVQVNYTNKNQATDLDYQPQVQSDRELMRMYIERSNSELDVDKLQMLGEDILLGVGE